VVHSDGRDRHREPGPRREGEVPVGRRVEVGHLRVLRRRLLQTNDVVRNYFEVNRALIENPTFREAYAMCNR